MRFYLDEHLSQQIAVVARARGLDVISSHECGRDKLPDDEQLRLAAEEGRCLVTRDRDDFVALTLQFFAQRWPHAGVLIVPKSLPDQDFVGIAAALVAFAQSYEGDLPSYTLTYLTPQRRGQG